jgi:hypothetical protein
VWCGRYALGQGTPDIFLLDASRFSAIRKMASDERIGAILPDIILFIFGVCIKPGPEIRQVGMSIQAYG